MNSIIAYFARRFVERSTWLAAVPTAVTTALLGIFYVDFTSQEQVLVWANGVLAALLAWLMPEKPARG